jgi:DedD protein
VEDNQLKQRLVGAIVLVSLAVIFIPMILSGSDPASSGLSDSVIPEKPEHDFVSRIIPLAQQAPETAEAVSSTPEARPEDKAVPTPQASKPESTPKAAVTTVTRPATTPASKPPPVVRKGLEAWVVQVGSFSSKENAYGLRDKLRGKGFPETFVDSIHDKDKTTYRVRLGPEVKKAEAERLLARLQKITGAKAFVTHYP